MGRRGDEKKNRSILGLWARKGIAIDGADEGANEIMLASYLLGFILFKLGRFVSWFSRCNLVVSASGSRFRL